MVPHPIHPPRPQARPERLPMDSRTWLLTVCAGTVLFGAVLILAPGATEAGFGWLIFGDPQRIAGWPAEARGYARLLHGVLGGVMIGWAVGLAWLVHRLWRAAPREAWQVMALSILTWYVPDSLHSLAQGAWQNALLNTLFAAMFAAGLWAARPGRPGATLQAA
jgi:hypothetical protein